MMQRPPGCGGALSLNDAARPTSAQPAPVPARGCSPLPRTCLVSRCARGASAMPRISRHDLDDVHLLGLDGTRSAAASPTTTASRASTPPDASAPTTPGHGCSHCNFSHDPLSRAGLSPIRPSGARFFVQFFRPSKSDGGYKPPPYRYRPAAASGVAPGAGLLPPRARAAGGQRRQRSVAVRCARPSSASPRRVPAGAGAVGFFHCADGRRVPAADSAKPQSQQSPAEGPARVRVR